MPFVVYHPRMENLQIKKELEKVANLSEFSRRYDLPLRTLHRIKVGECQPLRGTALILRSALQDYAKHRDAALDAPAKAG